MIGRRSGTRETYGAHGRPGRAEDVGIADLLGGAWCCAEVSLDLGEALVGAGHGARGRS